MKIAAMINQDFQAAVLALGNQRLAMPVAYKLKKILKRINEELTNYNELLGKLQETHKAQDGVVNQEAFMKDYIELVNMDVPVDQISIKDIEHVSISTKDLVVLEPILLEAEA